MEAGCLPVACFFFGRGWVSRHAGEMMYGLMS
jgi:hypothetical protein